MHWSSISFALNHQYTKWERCPSYKKFSMSKCMLVGKKNSNMASDELVAGSQSEAIQVWYRFSETLRWRHNGHNSVSNHQPHHCLLNHLFRCRSKNTSKLRVTGLCVGNSPGTSEFPAQMANNAEYVSIWWRHHVYCSDVRWASWHVKSPATQDCLSSCLFCSSTWWRHQMETFSTLLAICAGNSPVPGEFPAQRPVTRSFSLICARINGWVNNREAGDLRRHHAHYDVIILKECIRPPCYWSLWRETTHYHWIPLTESQ